MAGWEQWPRVPDGDRPKNLYVNVPLSPDDEAYLISRGWHPIDVRVLPNKTDAHKAQTLKAWLEGVRQGSIVVDKDIIKLIELEARTYGLVGQKTIEQPKRESDAEDTVDNLLEMFSSKRAVRTKTVTKRVHNEQGGHPYTASHWREDRNKLKPLVGIFNKKICRGIFEELVES